MEEKKKVALVALRSGAFPSGVWLWINSRSRSESTNLSTRSSCSNHAVPFGYREGEFDVHFFLYSIPAFIDQGTFLHTHTRSWTSRCPGVLLWRWCWEVGEGALSMSLYICLHGNYFHYLLLSARYLVAVVLALLCRYRWEFRNEGEAVGFYVISVLQKGKKFCFVTLPESLQ